MPGRGPIRGSDGLQQRREGLPEVPEGQPEGPEGLPEGSKGPPQDLPEGRKGINSGYIYFFPIPQDLSPCRAAAKKRAKKESARVVKMLLIDGSLEFQTSFKNKVISFTFNSPVAVGENCYKEFQYL